MNAWHTSDQYIQCNDQVSFRALVSAISNTHHHQSNLAMNNTPIYDISQPPALERLNTPRLLLE